MSSKGRTSKDKNVKRGLSTIAVHGGEDRNKYADSLTVPIVQTSTFIFRDEIDVQEYTSGNKKRFEYARYGTPTARTAELKLAELEGAEDALLFDCGMSALTRALLANLSMGDHLIITSDVYKKTLQFAHNDLSRFGIQTTVAAPDAKSIAAAIRKETKIIFSESPTNPYMHVIDIKEVVKTAKKFGVMTFIDSTFATPYNIKPLDMGVDVVIHSATKYLSGHNDIIAGVVLGNSDIINKIKLFQKTTGGCIDAHVAYLLIRGLKTFSLRIKQQNETAMYIAQKLEKHPKIKQIWYPGLKSHPSYLNAKKQMNGFGGVLTFEVNAPLKDVQKFLRNLKIAQMGPSFGGTETLITHPASITYYDMTKKQREQIGITDQLIRFAVGVEDKEDILADIEQALASIKTR